MMRNRFEYGVWVLEKVNDFSILQDFDCGDEDLNEYYRSDVLLHQRELLTQTYRFFNSERVNPVYALVDFCNDAVRRNKMTDEAQIRIPAGKRHYSFYPAVKITRLGVSVEAKGQGIGSLLLTAIKYFFLEDNRTGYRFLTVDAYNHPRVTHFYERNSFEFLELRESQRKDRLRLPMVFDLRNLI